jgi:FkbM family methyltransferase
MQNHGLKNTLKSAVLKATWLLQKPEIHDALFKSRSYEINELIRDFVFLFQDEMTLNQSKVVEALTASRSEIGQDVWALTVLNRARQYVSEVCTPDSTPSGWGGGVWQRGYFVDVGAWDGVECSNTHMFEKGLGWDGICVEPGPNAFGKLAKNRKCTSFNCAAWNESGQVLDFRETHIGSLSTLEGFGNDWAKAVRADFRPTQVESQTLRDLLAEAKAPPWVDYLSVDTEGSELQVLEGFPWETHNVGVASIEHNYTRGRKKLEDFMFDRGFEAVNRNISAYDAWFVSKSLTRMSD